MPYVRVEVGDRSILEAKPPFSALASGGLPKYTEESSWEAALFAEPRPVAVGPGNRFQSELELMGFAHKSGHSLRKSRMVDQPRANGRETHVGPHCLFCLFVTNM